jgi:hypothetical protein
MSPTKADGRKVAVVLMKSPEADAALDVLEADSAAVSVTDHDTFYLIEGVGEISIDIDRVGEELGEPISMSQFLVVMSSYVGRASPDDRHFTVTSDMLQLGTS